MDVDDDTSGAEAAYGVSVEDNALCGGPTYGQGAQDNPTGAETPHKASVEGVAIGGGAAYGDEDGVDR
jgi:hypothetical protein